MINLLEDNRKDQIKAARTNVILSRYIIILLLALLFLVAALFASYKILESTKESAEEIILSNDTKAGVYSETKAQVDALSSKLNESRAILDQEISYSALLTSLGQLMPQGAVIGTLDLNEASFNGTPMDIKVYTKTNEQATTVPINLQASPLFSQVSLKGTDSSSGIPGYPVSVTLTVTFNMAGL